MQQHKERPRTTESPISVPDRHKITVSKSSSTTAIAKARMLKTTALAEKHGEGSRTSHSTRVGSPEESRPRRPTAMLPPDKPIGLRLITAEEKRRREKSKVTQSLATNASSVDEVEASDPIRLTRPTLPKFLKRSDAQASSRSKATAEVAKTSTVPSLQTPVPAQPAGATIDALSSSVSSDEESTQQTSVRDADVQRNALNDILTSISPATITQIIVDQAVMKEQLRKLEQHREADQRRITMLEERCKSLEDKLLGKMKGLHDYVKCQVSDVRSTVGQAAQSRHDGPSVIFQGMPVSVPVT